jgi:aspartate/methionine/tyrosine aminotransferase
VTTSSLTPTHRLSAYAAAVPPSGIREIAHLVAGRDDVLHLEYGEPDFNAAPHIVAAATAAAEAGARYTPTPGPMQLRAALAAKLAAVQGLSYRPEQVVVTAGGAQALAAVFAATVVPGDEVMLPDPGFPNFRMLAVLHGARVVPYRLDPAAGFQPDPEEIERLLTPRTRLLVLNSPSNPTGAVVTAAAVERIVAAAAGNGTFVLSDEVYDQLVFDGTPVAAARFAPEWVVGVYSFSKSYAMTGWRLGYLAAADDVAATIARIQEPLISCTSALAQAGAMAALSGPEEPVGSMQAAYRRRRDLVVDRLRGAGMDVAVPQGAFYCMYPLSPGVDSRLAALALVHEGVACAPGSAFGDVARSHLRLSLAAADDVLLEAVDRLTAWSTRTDGGATLATEQPGT